MARAEEDVPRSLYEMVDLLIREALLAAKILVRSQCAGRAEVARVADLNVRGGEVAAVAATRAILVCLVAAPVSKHFRRQICGARARYFCRSARDGGLGLLLQIC